MWENAAPVPPPQAGAKSRRPPHNQGSEEDLVLLGQFFVCVVSLILVLLARTMSWPVLPALRVAFEQAMQPEQQIFLAGERDLAKFTEQAAQTISRAVDGLWNSSATPETASRTAHGKGDAVPSNARAESYLPDFSLTFPLGGQACAKTSGYGWRTDPMGGSGSDFHLGNDLAAAQGTQIVAAADGVVRYAGTHSSYGNYVRILHADGDETLYAHMQYLFVHTGQPVTAGQCLGTVGETGNATGPHLHFELLHKGIRYDPSEALQSAS